jgi:hypothetical protein
MTAFISLVPFLAMAQEGEFPADVKVGLWAEGESVEEWPIVLWGTSVAMETGGAGIVIGVVLFLLFTFSVFVFCCCAKCCCSRCCCCFKQCLPVFVPGERSSKLVAVMIICLCWSVMVMGLVGQGVQDGMAGIDKGFGGLIKAVVDTQDNLICSSKLDASQDALAKGCSVAARQFRADNCEEKSLARFIDKAETLVLELMDDGLTFVSGLSDDILSDMQDVENSTSLLQKQASNM